MAFKIAVDGKKRNYKITVMNYWECVYISLKNKTDIYKRKMTNNSSKTTSEFNNFSDDIGWYWFRVFFITITAFLDITCKLL